MTVITGNGDERAGVRCQARVQNDAGDDITQADVAAIEYAVFDVDVEAPVPNADGSIDAVEYEQTAEGDIDPEDCIFDTLQPWDVDGDGYNFSFVVPAAAFPDKSIYRIDFKITPTEGEPYYVKFNNVTDKTFIGGEAATT